MTDTADLPDINVWLAIGIAEHPDHECARRYWREESAERIAFCRVTALGFVRIATNPAAMRERPLTIPEAWQLYRDFRDLPEVRLASEPERCETALDGWVSAGQLTHRVWTDAYLAAFARESGMRLVSFDRDFARFDGLSFLRLEA